MPDQPQTPPDPAPKQITLREFQQQQMERDLDTLTEAIVEVYLEANPKIAHTVGRA